MLQRWSDACCPRDSTPRQPSPRSWSTSEARCSSLVARLQNHEQAVDAAAIALLVGTGLALAWLSKAPLASFGATVLGVSAYLLLGYPYGPIQLCAVYAMFELARLRPLRISLPACLIAAGAIVAAVLSRAVVEAAQPPLLAAVWASWLVVPWAIGALVNVRTAATRRSRDELMARAALEERMRVSRDVHDIAGHGFSAVAMQAGVALVVFDEQPAQARESLEAIQSTSKQALAELRTMLDAFHNAAGLRDLPALVDSLRAAGLQVRVDTEHVELPNDLDGVAYRVVQEALTNVLRHAGPTTAEVSVRREQDELVVEVIDHGTGTDEVRPGRGLAGMRSRVTAAGGELVTESPSGQGFRVVARLPLGVSE